MKPLTDEERLELISNLVESDAGFESDCTLLDVAQGRAVTVRERILAELVSNIYRAVHPRFAKCGHMDWEVTNRDMLEDLRAYENPNSNQ